jgi:plastocyanin
VTLSAVATAGPIVLALSACGNGPPPGGVIVGGSPAIQVTVGATPGSTVKESDDLKFSPTTTTIQGGEVVEWDNSGTTPHNVTFDSGPASPTMNGGERFQAKFSQPGNYHYVCTFHAPGMSGTITVLGTA